MKLQNVFIGLLFFISSAAYCQVSDVPVALASRLEGKKKFTEIMNEVDNYYKSNNFHADKKLFSQYKKWNRWAWWAARHLNEKGEVAYDAAKLFETAEQIKNAARGATSNSGQWTAVGPFTTTYGPNNNRGTRGIGRIDKILIHPNFTNIILAGSPSGGLWRSNNSGDTWFSISSYIPNCGVAGLAFDSNDPTGNTILMLTGNSYGAYFLGNGFNFNENSLGILITRNGGNTWNKLGNSQSVFNSKRNYKLIQLRGFPNVLLVATDNGVYGSYDFGNSWSRITQNDRFFDVEQHPTNDAIVYCSSSFSVLISTDYGQSFTTSGNMSPIISLSNQAGLLAVTPAQPNEVYYMQCDTAFNRRTIYKSINSGNNFNLINNQNLIQAQAFYNYAFAVHPINNNFMTAGGFAISTSISNGSNGSFTNFTSGGGSNPMPTNYVHPDIHDLVYSPTGDRIYAATDGGVFLSRDNGLTWADKSVGLQCTQFYKMEGFDGVENLYIGGTQDNGTFYSTNGSNMVYAGSGDGYASDFVNTNNDTFFLVENTEVSRYQRSTNSIAWVSNTIPNANKGFYPDLICHPTNGNIVYLAYDSTVWRTNNKGAAWTQVATFSNNNGGLTPSRTYNGGFAVSPQQPDKIFAASATQVRMSTNQGTSWSVISGTAGWPTNIGTITDIASSSSNADIVVITATGNNGANRILYSSNNGQSWVNLTGSLPNVPVYSVSCTSNYDLYIGTEIGVFYMAFAMNDWVPFYNGLPIIPVTDLFVNETNQVISAATLGRGIWRSDLYGNCAPFLTLGSNVQGKYFYQTAGVLQSAQNMNGSYGNELRYRSPVQIKLTNGFRAYAGSYLHAIIGPCGQGVFNKTNVDTIKRETILLPVKNGDK